MPIEEADLAILRLLQADARRSMRELARGAGVSTPTASARVRALEAKGVLRGYAACVEPEALGELVVFVLARAAPADAPKVARALALRAEVRAVHLLGAGRVAAFATLEDPGREGEFLASLAKVPAISALDAFPVIERVKDLPLAVIDRAVTFAVKCEFCGRRTKDEPVRLKVGPLVHFLCCESCKAGYAERIGRLRALSAKAKGRSSLDVVEG